MVMQRKIVELNEGYINWNASKTFATSIVVVIAATGKDLSKIKKNPTELNN